MKRHLTFLACISVSFLLASLLGGWTWGDGLVFASWAS